jgi:hypothetical protein
VLLRVLLTYKGTKNEKMDEVTTNALCGLKRTKKALLRASVRKRTRLTRDFSMSPLGISSARQRQIAPFGGGVGERGSAVLLCVLPRRRQPSLQKNMTRDTRQTKTSAHFHQEQEPKEGSERPAPLPRDLQKGISRVSRQRVHSRV